MTAAHGPVRPETTFVLPDKLGGVASVVANLLAYRAPDDLDYGVVLTDDLASDETRVRDAFRADRIARIGYRLPPENVYAVLRRVVRAIRPGPGVLVANDWIELACATTHDTGRAVVAIVHGDMDFYYDLAVRHAAAIDLFVALTARIRDRLLEIVPERADDIVLQPFGVSIPASRRVAEPGPLRLLYSGRLRHDKGIFDLPLIDRALAERAVDVRWTIQGAGPDEAELRERWASSNRVQWTGYQPMPRVLDGYRRHDVLVMPSRHEGLPVALLEAGAAGVVPVVSDLRSGIPDVVTRETGLRPAAGDISAFAASIERLANDRALLESMSCAVRDRVSARFEAVSCAAAYQAIFARGRERRRPHRPDLPLSYGSRLDRPWIPNAIVRAIRTAARLRA